MKRVLLIDNYDSFTYNLKSYFEVLGAQVNVVKNDEISVASVQHYHPSHIVLSPGPGNPDDAGITMEVIKSYYRTYPILGVCLGHQCIAAVWGVPVVQLNKPMHGKVSILRHQGCGIFVNLPTEFKVARYHSLVVSDRPWPDDLEVIARVTSIDQQHPGAVMALRHRHFPLVGLQYHPEAILTEYGYDVLRQFLTFVV